MIGRITEAVPPAYSAAAPTRPNIINATKSNHVGKLSDIVSIQLLDGVVVVALVA